MKNFIGLVLVTLIPFSGFAQESTYRVYFKDKGEMVSLLSTPESFLSGKAIWRRAKHNISVDETDLPVSLSYKTMLKPYGNLLYKSSKWMNYTLVETSESQVAQIEKLPFVKRVESVNKVNVHFADAGCATNNFNYGQARLQIEQIRGNEFHDFGFTGDGMTIAVLDGGFTGALPGNAGFDSLYVNGQIKGSFSFVHNDTNVFRNGSHGALVLSVMGGNIPNGMVGSAPDANYWLFMSEDESQETTVEMDNWVLAAEFADSVGVDVINSSLGYTTFDGGVGDLSQSDMDGNTAVVTRGADMAAQKGILVVASAGNGGNSIWPIIGAPADGDSVMTVGGVDGNGDYVSFSSSGPSADGRIKPDVVGLAQGATLINASGVIFQGNGTSFSSPLIAGMAACLWQSQPTMSNMEIYQAIISTASHYFTPNNEVGFGLPDFIGASFSISLEEEKAASTQLQVYPNPAKGNVNLEIDGIQGVQNVTIKLHNVAGKQVLHEGIQIGENQRVEIKAPKQPGLYLLTVSGETVFFTEEIIFQ